MAGVPFVSSRDLDISVLPDPGPCAHTLMVSGGRRPDPKWLDDFARRNSPVVWAVDSGAGSCRAGGVVPSVVIGDMDSASGEDREWALASGAEEILFSSDKDATDFQLALGLWGEKKPLGSRLLLVSGCFGGRFDHLQSAVNTFALDARWTGPGETPRRCMIDDLEGLFFLCSKETVNIKFRRPPLAVSLLPFTDECGGVRISGVRWPLAGASLSRGQPWAVSNELEAGRRSGGVVSVSCGEGVLAVYWRLGLEV
ncbi:MAG: thiamine diphosphokinase [Synergistaceae bacterium]|jgi:thiamine pyrophosphokinase|nr:thiamine diphosphokinase [Synergistaceae bacterium]